MEPKKTNHPIEIRKILLNKSPPFWGFKIAISFQGEMFKATPVGSTHVVSLQKIWGCHDKTPRNTNRGIPGPASVL